MLGTALSYRYVFRHTLRVLQEWMQSVSVFKLKFFECYKKQLEVVRAAALLPDSI